MNKKINLIVISRISDPEDSMIRDFLNKEYSKNYSIILVGHTNLNPQEFNFKYIEFWDKGLDGMGWITKKKNIGVSAAENEYCLVCHADTFPSESFYENFQKLDIKENEVICPVGSGLTWCSFHNGNGGRKNHDEPFNSNTYISGGVIFGPTEVFKKYKWDENLYHNQAEDYHYSRYLEKNGIIQRLEKSLVVNMHNGQ